MKTNQEIIPNITEVGPYAGQQAEYWAARLHSMRKRRSSEEGNHDLVFIPDSARVEVKFSNTRVIENDLYSPTERFLWKDITYGQFDWLLLIGKYSETRYFYWLEAASKAFLLLQCFKDGEYTTGSQIAYNLTTINPRFVTAYLRANIISLEELYQRCVSGKLETTSLTELEQARGEELYG